MHKKNPVLLGAHLSIAGGLTEAITRGQAIGCTAIQIFTHSNRQWHIKPLTTQEIADFRAQAAASSILSYVAHASYLINLASPTAVTRNRSVQALIEEMARCAQLGIQVLVLHPGSATDGDKEAGMQRLATSLDEACKAVEGVYIALENMAGQGSALGSSFEELATIKKQCAHKNRIRFCLDTCHAFAAGYVFDTPASYKKFKEQIDDTIGLDNIVAIHINDSAKLQGSRVDRHAHIGQGHIPLESFAHLMNDHDFAYVPKILETPKDDAHSDEKNMATLMNLCT